MNELTVSDCDLQYSLVADRHKDTPQLGDSSITYTINGAKRNLCPQKDLKDWQSTGVKRVSIGSVTNTSVALGCGKVFHDSVMRIPSSTFENDVYGDTLPDTPIVLTGCCDNWKAFESPGKSWDVHDLANRYTGLVALDGGPSFARLSLCSAKVSLNEYLRYCGNDADGDDAPLYVFDPDFLKHDSTFDGGDSVRREFSIPPCFSHDEMACCNGSRFRPLPPAWLLVGATRSGTPIHNHPMTVAWNALLSGCKLWCCLPPDVTESALLLNFDQDSDDEADDAFDLSALQWFEQCEDLPEEACVIVQHPGEVVFLPVGWFHVVLNVKTSTAISVSLTLRKDLPDLLEMLLESDAEFAAFWKERLAI
jgi:histone arginine demethylase JMJD6